MSKRKINYAVSALAKTEIKAFESRAANDNHYVILLNEIIYQSQICDWDPVSRRSVINQLELQNKIGTNKSTMANREASLKSLGVFEERMEFQGKSQVLIREIKTLAPIIKQYLTQESDEDLELPRRLGSKKQMSLAFEELEKNHNILLPTGNGKSSHEALFTGILDAAVRMSRSDNRKVIEVKYNFGRNDSILITTSTDTRASMEIIELPDYRVIRALGEMYVNWVELEHGCDVAQLTEDQVSEISGEFIFDIYDLCTELNFSRNIRNANSVRAILARIYATHFHIDAENSPFFREKFSNGAHVFNVKFLTESSEYKEYESDNESNVIDFNTRLYRIKFHSYLLRGLIDPRTRHISHPALVREKSGICHRFNSWSKIAIGVTTGKADSEKWYLLDELWEKVMPSSRADNFYKYFIRVLERHCVGGEHAWDPNNKNVSLVYGYYVEYHPNDHKMFMDLARIKRRSHMYKLFKKFPVIRIWRDREDEIVGDNSPHNLKVRRTQANLKDHMDSMNIKSGEGKHDKDCDSNVA